MAIMKKFVMYCKCERCSHTWIPRINKTPEVCPKCKSPYWNKPRNKAKRNVARRTNRVNGLRRRIDKN